MSPSQRAALSAVKQILTHGIRAAARLFSHATGLTRASRWSAEVIGTADDLAFSARDEFEYRFSAANPLLLWRARTLLSKEPETIAWIRSFSAADVFFDVGANIGAYTVFAARRCRQTYAFEPESANYAVLNRNIQLNGLARKARAFPVAISDTMRLDSLRLSAVQAGAALHVFGRDIDFKSERFDAVFEQGAIALTMDQLVYDLGLEKPTHIKIDVDGLEPEVLRGANRTLAHPALRSVLVEINEREDSDLAIVQQLAVLGFRVARKGEPVAEPTGRARMVNYIFARG